MLDKEENIPPQLRAALIALTHKAMKYQAELTADDNLECIADNLECIADIQKTGSTEWAVIIRGYQREHNVEK